MQLLFRSEPSGFASDEAKIVTAGSYSTSLAYIWFPPHINSTNGEITFKEYNQFMDVLGVAFDDPDSYATAEKELESLRQETSCAAYYPRMVSTFFLTRLKRRESSYSFFRRGLNESFKDALVGKKLQTMFAEFVTICVALDN